MHEAESSARRDGVPAAGCGAALQRELALWLVDHTAGHGPAGRGELLSTRRARDGLAAPGGHALID